MDFSCVLPRLNHLQHIADREQKMKMLICDKVQQNPWPLRLIWEGHWIPLCISHNVVSEEDELPAVETCLSRRLKLPFDPRLYLGGINDWGMNRREIPIHLALSESPVRDLSANAQWNESIRWIILQKLWCIFDLSLLML